MQNFLTRSGPGLLVVGAAAALGYAVLMPPACAQRRRPRRARWRTTMLSVRCADFLSMVSEKKSSKNGAESARPRICRIDIDALGRTCVWPRLTDFIRRDDASGNNACEC